MEITSLDNYNDFIHIDLNVIYICNMKCKYCYARAEEPWNKMMKKEILDICLRRISSLKECHVNILGGEPSLYPFLEFLICKLESMENVKLVKIYTNGIKDLRKYKSDKIKLVYTTHCREAQEKDNLNNILSKVQKDDYITIMFEDDPRLLDFYEKIKDFPLIEGNFIQYGNVPDFKLHPLAFLQNECLCNGKIINQEEYSQMDISRCKCHMNYFSVNFDGSVTNCLQTGSIKDFDFKDVYLQCPYKNCRQVCYMYQRKFK